MSNEPRFSLTCVPGLEPLLLEELKEFGIDAEASGPGAVSFTANWREASRVALRTRLGSRFLYELRAFSAKNPAMLYDQVRRIDWTEFFGGTRTLAVFAHGRTEGMRLSFAPLKIKDAICDEIRKKGQERPDVDTKNPDVRVEAFFSGGKCRLSLDLTGEPLHRRGYREAMDAPLRENRAAALLRFVGYRDDRPFVDPFCGSGTIALEAAAIACRRAPGLARGKSDWPMIRLFPESAHAFDREYDEAKSEEKKRPDHPIAGYDSSNAALKVATLNAQRAGLGFVRFEKRLATELEAPNSWIVANPPYGERLGERKEAVELLSAFTRQAKHNSAGSTLGLVLEAGELEKAVGFKPARKLSLPSGELQLKFLKYELFAGKKVSKGAP